MVSSLTVSIGIKRAQANHPLIILKENPRPFETAEVEACVRRWPNPEFSKHTLSQLAALEAQHRL